MRAPRNRNFCCSKIKIIPLTVHTISSRHKQIFPYLSRKSLSVGGFPHTSLRADVITKIASDTANKSRRWEVANKILSRIPNQGSSQSTMLLSGNERHKEGYYANKWSNQLIYLVSHVELEYVFLSNLMYTLVIASHSFTSWKNIHFYEMSSKDLKLRCRHSSDTFIK